MTQNLDTPLHISRAIHSQIDLKSSAAFDLTVPDFDLETSAGGLQQRCEGIQVRIERADKSELNPRASELEDYSRSVKSRDARPRR